MDMKLTNRKFEKSKIQLHLSGWLAKKLHKAAKPYTVESYIISLIDRELKNQ